MADAAHKKVLTLEGREIVIRELTVADVRKLLAPSTEQDLVNHLFEDVRLTDLQLLTSLGKDDIEALHPSSLAVVIEECRALNAHFFALLGRL